MEKVSTFLKPFLTIYSILLVGAYFMAIGYYDVFHINITPFLTIEDIIFLFSPSIWFTCILLFLLYIEIRIVHKERWPAIEKWGVERLFSKWHLTRFGGIFILILLGIIITWTFSTKMSMVFNIIFVSLFIIVSYYISEKIRERFFSTKSLVDYTLIFQILLLGAVIFSLVLFPFWMGEENAKEVLESQNKPDILVEFKDGERLNLKDSTNLLYIKGTHDYFLLYNRKKEMTYIYRMEEIKVLKMKDMTLL